MIRLHATPSTTWMAYDSSHQTFTIEGPGTGAHACSKQEALCCLEHPQIFDCSLDVYRRLLSLSPFGNG